jgi:hypothetical protein
MLRSCSITLLSHFTCQFGYFICVSCVRFIYWECKYFSRISFNDKLIKTLILHEEASRLYSLVIQRDFDVSDKHNSSIFWGQRESPFKIPSGADGKQREQPDLFSNFKTEIICSSETLESLPTTRRHGPKVLRLHNHRCENLKIQSYSHKFCFSKSSCIVYMIGLTEEY